MLVQFDARLASGNRSQGTSAKGDWTKIEAIFEVAGERWTDTLPVTFFNEKCQLLSGVKVGDAMHINANLRAREWNQRFYLEMTAVSATKIEEQPIQQQPIQQQPKTTANEQAFINALHLQPVQQQPIQQQPIQQQSNIEIGELPF